MLEEAYDAISTFRPRNQSLPMALFGVVLDRQFRQGYTVTQREQFAYEVLLNKFDMMVGRHRQAEAINYGLVIHDKRVVAERDIQEWTREWRKAAGAIGQIRNLADVPLFADSKATRLIQAADLVSYAIWRHYLPGETDLPYMDRLWGGFDRKEGSLHGIVHYSPSYGAGSCPCRPCRERLINDAVSLNVNRASE